MHNLIIETGFSCGFNKIFRAAEDLNSTTSDNKPTDGAQVAVEENQGKIDFKNIEKFWQDTWLHHNLYAATDGDTSREKKYILTEFPYPSGASLHVGHAFRYTVPDVYSRFLRMSGYNVLFPIGWDAFGLPTEERARKEGKNPKVITKENISNFKKQVLRMGYGFDWNREFATTDEDYYKWTQWIFGEFYKAGLAEQKEIELWWCPEMGTVLSNEEVLDGPDGTKISERGEHPVFRKKLKQWILKMPQYAEKLLDGLEETHFPEHIKDMQRNWIGKSEGCTVRWEVASYPSTPLSGEEVPPNPLNRGREQGQKLKVVILHGFKGDSNTIYIPWLKSQLQELGHEVVALDLPNFTDPNEQESVDFVLKSVKFDSNTIILGHSLGSVVAFKVLEKLNSPILGLITTGGFVDTNFLDKDINVRPFVNKWGWNLNFEKIKSNITFAKVLQSTTETVISDSQAEALASRIGTKVDFVQADDHFGGSVEPSVWNAFEEVLGTSKNKIKELQNTNSPLSQRGARGDLDGVAVDLNGVKENSDNLRAQSGLTIQTFTTRIDTIFAATFLVLAPEHELVHELTTEEQKDVVHKYLEEVQNKSERERQIGAEKTGVFTGSYAINPITGATVPICVADYVLGGYGTGAIMAVPGHDERDFEFATKFGLEVEKCIKPTREYEDVDQGVLLNHLKELLEMAQKANFQIILGSGFAKDLVFERKNIKHSDIDIFVDQKGYEILRDYYTKLNFDTEKVSDYGWKDMQSFFLDKLWVDVFLLKKDQAGYYDEIANERFDWGKGDQIFVKKQFLGSEVLVPKADLLLKIDKNLKSTGIKIFQEYGVLYESGEYTGLTSEQAKDELIQKLEVNGGGKKEINYKFRDWVFSRQRYWGEPFPFEYIKTDQKTKHLIFDFDGVLADSLDAFAQAYLCLRPGTKENSDEAKQIFIDHHTYHPRDKFNFDDPIESEKELQIRQEWGAKALEIGFNLFEELIAEVKKIPNVQMAVVSSGSENYVKHYAHKTGLKFSHVYGAETHLSKEHKVAMICKDWGIETREVYLITDTQSDVLELKKMLDTSKIYGASWGWHGFERLSEVLPKNQILQNFEDIHRIFELTNETIDKYLIFDMDGVLSDSLDTDIQMRINLNLFDSKDWELNKQETIVYFDQPRHNKQAKLSPEEIKAETEKKQANAREYVRIGVKYFDSFIEQIKKIPNAKIAVVSSGSNIYVKDAAAKIDLPFTHVLGFEDGHSKEEKIERIIKEWGVPVDQTYYFTDTKADVIELRDFLSKDKLIGCAWGWHGFERLSEVLPKNQILQNFEDIHRIFDNAEYTEIDGELYKVRLLDIPELPLILPDVEDYLPSPEGRSPLAKVDWINIRDDQGKVVGKREPDTMPNWAGSSWYYLRYCDPQNGTEFANYDKLKYWLPVDHYFGGSEHTTLHLLYSRFWHKFLFDQGYVPTTEPYDHRTNGGLLLGPDGRKMSKSLGNVISPDEKLEVVGADALRLYINFIGPYDGTVIWQDGGLKACKRLVDNVWSLREKVEGNEKLKINNEKLGEEVPLARGESPQPSLIKGETENSPLEGCPKVGAEVNTKLLVAYHKMVKKVGEQIPALRTNVAVAELMTFVNVLKTQNSIPVDIWKGFLQVLAPLAPHIAEELWYEANGFDKADYMKSIHLSSWPVFDPQLCVEDEVTIVVQINGKVRAEFQAAKDSTEAELMLRAIEVAQKWLAGKEIKFSKVVPNKMVTFAVG